MAFDWKKWFGGGTLNPFSGSGTPFVPPQDQQGQQGGGGWQEALFGSPGGLQGFRSRDPQQEQFMQQLAQLGMNQYKNPYEGFQGIQDYAHQQFNQKTLPSLTERFTAGTNGALSSPGFAQQVGEAGAGMDVQLAALKSQYGLQNQQNALMALSQGLQPVKGYTKTEGSEGMVSNLIQTLGPAAIKLLAASYGIPL